MSRRIAIFAAAALLAQAGVALAQRDTQPGGGELRPGGLDRAPGPATRGFVPSTPAAPPTPAPQSSTGGQLKDGWTLFGAQRVGTAGGDAAAIKVGRGAGQFRRLRITIKDGALALEEVRVVYESGSEEPIAVGSQLQPGGTFGPVDLKGGPREIREIRLKYRPAVLDAKAAKGQPTVEVWGQR